jgi:hypothetical protein
MRTDPPTTSGIPDALQVYHRSARRDQLEVRSRSWSRRPSVIIAEILATHGICEKVAVDVANDILMELRREGYSLYRADGLLGA